MRISISANLGDGSATNTIGIRDGAVLESTGANVDLGTNRSVIIGGSGAEVRVSGSTTNRLVFTAVVSSDHDCGPLTKTGVGVLELRAANTYTSSTIVSEGTLWASNTSGSATGTGSVTVATGATLVGDGFIAPGTDRGITLNGLLAVGDPLAVTGTDLSLLTSGTGTVTLGATSTLTFDLWSGVGSGTLNVPAASDLLVFGGTSGITLGGTLEVLNMSGSTDWMKLDSWQLFDWSSLTGGVEAPGTGSNVFSTINLPTLTAGFAWDTSALYTAGVITIVPEPGRAMLLIFGLLGLMMRRRR